MAKKYIDADRLKELLDAKYKEFTEKAKKDCPLQYQYMADGLDIAEQFINSLQQEQQEVDLEKEIADFWTATGWCQIMTLSKFKVIARYFYGLGLNAKEENK